MDYGFELNNGQGQPSLSMTSEMAAIKDVINAEAGMGGMRSYPDLAGRVLRVINISSTLVFDYTGSAGSIAALKPIVSVAYPGGVPTFTWTYQRTLPTDVFVDATLIVFAL